MYQADIHFLTVSFEQNINVIINMIICLECQKTWIEKHSSAVTSTCDNHRSLLYEKRERIP